MPRSRWFALFAAFVLPLWSPCAYAQIHNIWARSLPLEPGDTQPFRAIQPPRWLEDLTCLTYCFSVSDAATRDIATAAGSQMSEMGFVNPIYVAYSSEYLHRKDPGVAADALSREIADYKRRHVRILGVVPPGLQGEIYSTHPEWRKISTNTTQIPVIDPASADIGGGLCLLGPWGDRLIDILSEVLKRNPDVDGFSFDGLHHAGVCYCANCRATYRKEKGEEIPNPDMNSAEFRRFVRWQDRQLEQLIIRIQTRLKQIKPEVALVSWTTNAGRFGHLLDIPRNMSARTNLLLDAPDQEFWMDETNRGNTLMPAFANAVIWAASDHRIAFSSPYLFSHGNPYGPDSFPGEEAIRRAMLAITWGARPSLAIAQPAPLKPAVMQIIREIKRVTPWITHVSEAPWAALLLSDNTRCFYGRDPGRVEERYIANVLGTFRACVEEHLPVSIIEDWNLTAKDLSRYKVLLIPNSACLSEPQMQAIRDYVRNGGGLVASMDASLFTEAGEPRKNFGLSDVFGVNYIGAPHTTPAGKQKLDENFLKGLDASYWEKRKNIFDFTPGDSMRRSQPRLHDLIGDQPVVFKGQASEVRIIDNSTAVAATFTLRGSSGPPQPAIVNRAFGKGKVCYFAVGTDSANYLYAYPYYRVLLANAIRSVASEPPAVTVSAPMCVHFTQFLQQNAHRNRVIVHLFNDLNTTAGHAKPDDDVPLREEVVPIHDIRLHFNFTDIAGIRLEPEGIQLTGKRVSGGIEIVVPKLNIHTMVVIDRQTATITRH